MTTNSTDLIEQCAGLVSLMQCMIFEGAIDTMFEHPSLHMWPDEDATATANELDRSFRVRANGLALARVVNALAATLAGPDNNAAAAVA
jgi:hypothetical protein